MRLPIPDWLSSKRVSKPSLIDSLSFYYKSFSDLCSERQFAEVCLSLKWSSIKDYAEYYGLDSEQSETFIYLMRKMDNAYVRNAIKDKDDGSKSGNNETV